MVFSEKILARERKDKMESSPVNCSPWEDYVERHKGESAIGLVMFVNCVATILANILLFAVIFSKKESRDQVIF